MSITSRINEIETHLKEDYTNLEALGYDIPQDKNIENIASVLDNVWENQSHIEETGTTLSMNTNKGKAKVDLLGNTQQDSLTGKNLCDLSSFEGNNSTFTFTNTNGLLDLKATGTTGAQYIREVLSGFDSSKTYMFSMKSKKINKGTGSNSYIRATLAGSNDGENFTSINSIGESNPTINQEYSKTQILTGYTYYRIYLYNNIATPVDVGEETQYYDLQIEEGSSATDYEPYCGGIPSPNPSYPQDIHVVSGDNTITSTGKNLFSGYTKGIGINATTGVQVTDANGATSVYIPLKVRENNKYEIWGLPTTISTFVAGYNKDKVFVGRTGGVTLGELTLAPQLFTGGTPQGTGDIEYVRVYTYKISTSTGTIDDIDNANVMLESGTTATTYEPYVSSSYQVNLPVENLFDGTQVTTTHPSNWGVSFENNVLTIEHKTSYSSGAPNIVLGSLPSGDYTLSYKSVNKMSLYINGTYDQLIDDGETFVVEDGKTYAFYFSVADNSPVTFTNILLEKGNKVNSYTPYGTTPIELCKIGTYQDKFFKAINGNTIYDNLDSTIKNTLDYGDWYLNKQIGNVVLDGEEANWTEYTNTASGLYKAYTTSVKVGRTNDYEVDGYSNYFDVLNVFSQGSAYVNMALTKNATYLSLPSSIASSIESLRTWLGTHNTEIRYILATPTYTPITGTLASQLEDVWRANTYDNQTNVSQVNNDLPFELYFKALGTPSNTLLGLSRNLQLNQENVEQNVEEEPIEEIEESGEQE